MNALLAKLVPAALGAIPAEGRAALCSVVELAKGAAEIGPPSPPPNIVAACRLFAGSAVPWQLIAAASFYDPARGDLGALVEAATAGGLVAGVRTWAASDDKAERILFAYLVLMVRELDADGLEVLGSVFRNG